MTLRLGCFCILLLCGTLTAGSDVWRSVSASPAPVEARDVQLSEAQQGLIKSTLKKNNHVWECASDDPGGKWAENLRFSAIPLADGQQTILVEAGPGCARGGQGANGAMWVVQLSNGQVTVLASPAQDFDGWLYAVQPSVNKGYHDVVLAWHMSARETGLGYFRFDGTRYKRLSSADMQSDDSGHTTITPAVDKSKQ